MSASRPRRSSPRSIATRVTIVDVALAAEVSVSTVSKVINDRYGVAPETYDKVMDVVAELGYESSLVASSHTCAQCDQCGALDFSLHRTGLSVLFDRWQGSLPIGILASHPSAVKRYR